MGDNSFILEQNIFKDPQPSIHVIRLDENVLVSSPHILGHFLATAVNGVIGLAPVYGAKCALQTVAFASLSQVLIIRFTSSEGKKKKKHSTDSSHSTPARTFIQDNVLCHPDWQKYAFRMDKLSSSLFLDHHMRITGGVDLLSLSKSSRRSFDAVMNALGGETTLQKDNVKALFKHEETISASPGDVALQAWAACRAGSLRSMEKKLREIPRIDTQSMPEQVCLSYTLDLQSFDPCLSRSISTF